MKNYFLPLDGSRSVAVSDVHLDRRTESAGIINSFYLNNGIKSPECKHFLDFEEILDRDDIDAVVIGTPDHWHLPASILAARAGKHIYLEKPLGLSYPNYLLLKEEMEARNLRFQYGTQQRASAHMKLGVDLVREGSIGEIKRVEVWCPGINPVESPVCETALPVPETFDFDRWTGPAPLRPFCPDRVTNNSSWFIDDYSIGFLAGWGAHPLDILVWALKDQIEGTFTCDGKGGFWAPGGLYNNVDSWDLNYSFGKGINTRFFSWDMAESKNLLHYLDRKSHNGTTFFGTKGWISLSRNSAKSDVPEINKKLNADLKNYVGPGEAFIDAIRGKRKELCPLSDAIISDSISHVGNMAVRTGRKITWDTKKGKVTGDSEANRLFIRELREPYGV